VPGLPRFALALGFAVALPAITLAGVPRGTRPEVVDRERAELHRAIVGVRALVAQLKSDVQRGRFCGPLEELRAAERLLGRLEWAYVYDVPYPVKPSKPSR
jgi:hypothetical protein